MTATATLAKNQESYFEAFRAGEAVRAAEPAWLHRRREEAWDRFAANGFPDTHNEEWRFTNPAPVTRANLAPAAKHPADSGLTDLVREYAPGPRLVFVNGRYQARLSTPGKLPAGITAAPLSQALTGAVAQPLEAHLGRLAAVDKTEHAFAALNTALFEDGAFVRVNAGAEVEQPLYLLHIAAGEGAAHPRCLIVAGERSQAAIVQVFVSAGQAVSLSNLVTEIVCGPGAILEHYHLQVESAAAFHVAVTQAHLERGAVVTDHSITLGGRFVRNDVNMTLAGQGAEVILNGLYVTKGDQHVDNHTRLEHAQPHCPSREIYKGILDGKSSAVFNGSIIVRPDAQKTDAKQSNKNLLLSPDATVNTKPQLEIWADDVKCTHGATVGQLDAEAIFYLRSRGVGLEEARAILTHAFCNDVLNRMKVESIRARAEAWLTARLRS